MTPISTTDAANGTASSHGSDSDSWSGGGGNSGSGEGSKGDGGSSGGGSGEGGSGGGGWGGGSNGQTIGASLENVFMSGLYSPLFAASGVIVEG